MDLLIIGNGFDLAHHFPTRYTDFLKYCRDYNKNNPISMSDDMNEDFSSSISDNIWIKYFSHSIQNIKNSQTWIDFEKEIAEIIHLLDIANLTTEEARYFNAPSEIVLKLPQGNVSAKFLFFISLFCTFNNDSKAHVVEIESIVDTHSLIELLYLHLRSFARAFEIYCLAINAKPMNKAIITTERKQKIEKAKLSIEQHSTRVRQARSCTGKDGNILRSKQIVDIETKNLDLLNSEIKPIDYLGMSKFNYVLSFNYTNTYERLYGNVSTKYCYIHGKAQENRANTNIIFGIDDELPRGEESKNFNFVRFKKYYQRIIFKTGSEYKDWLIPSTNQNNSRYYVHIVGHSLDKTDYDVLYEIFSKNHLKIIIYYYNTDDFEDKIRKTIQLLACKGGNGRDELIRRVHGAQWSIKFVNQYDKAEGLFFCPDDAY